MLTANSIDDGIGLPRYCSCLFIVHRLSPVHLIILMTDHISAYVSQRQMNWKAFFLKVGTRTKRMMGIRTLSLNLLFLFCSLTLRSKWSWKYNAKPRSVRKIHLTVLTDISHCRWIRYLYTPTLLGEQGHEYLLSGWSREKCSKIVSLVYILLECSHSDTFTYTF